VDEVRREPIAKHEHISGTNTEHNERVSVQTVAKAAPARKRLKLAYRQGPDVADPSALQMTGASVMDRMAAAPGVVRRQRKHADDTTNPIVHVSMAEEGTMSAIVLDHKQSHEKPRCDY
jgi:hypothetical protein